MMFLVQPFSKNELNEKYYENCKQETLSKVNATKMFIVVFLCLFVFEKITTNNFNSYLILIVIDRVFSEANQHNHRQPLPAQEVTTFFSFDLIIRQK